MPSSSSRLTHLERHIHRLFRRTWLCLFSANQRKCSIILLHKFAELLDINYVQLFATLELPPSGEANTALWVEETAALNQIRKEVAELSDAYKVYHAGGFLSDVGFLLEQVGRLEEARQWWLWGGMLRLWGIRSKDAASRQSWLQDNEEDMLPADDLAERGGVLS